MSLDTTLKNSCATLAKASSISLLLRLLGRAVSFLTNFIFARIFGAEILGNYYLGITFLSILTSISGFGIPKGVLRFVSEFSAKNETDDLYSIIPISLIGGVFGSLVMVCLVLLLQGHIVALFHETQIYVVIRYFLWVLPVLVVSSIMYEILRGLKQFTVINAGQSFLSSLFLLVAFLVIYEVSSKDLGLSELISSYAISNIAIVVIYSYVLWRIIPANKIFLSIKKQLAGDLLRISLPLLFAAASSMVFTWVDTLMLSGLATASDVGIYGTASRVSILLAFLFRSVSSVVPPLLVELNCHEDKSALQNYARIITSGIAFLEFFLLLIFCVFSYEIMSSFGHEFGVGWNCLIILSLGNFSSVLFGTAGIFLMVSGGERFIAANYFVNCLLNICGALILVPKYGITGAAISTALTLALVGISNMWYSRNKFNISWLPNKPLLTLCCLVFLFSLSVFTNVFCISVVAKVIVLICEFVIWCAYFYYKVLEQDDKRLLKMLTARIRGRSLVV